LIGREVRKFCNHVIITEKDQSVSKSYPAKFSGDPLLSGHRAPSPAIVKTKHPIKRIGRLASLLLVVLLPSVEKPVKAQAPSVIFNGNNTHSGTETFSGSVLVKNLNAIRFADQFAGADCGAKLNAAEADLGATPGDIWVTQNS